jgi:tetratricopeptide (TPR) repeat protein
LVGNIAAKMPGVPRSLSSLVNRCLQADPLKRLTAEGLAKELNRYLRRRVRRRRIIFGGIGLVGSGVLAWQLSMGTSPPPYTHPLPENAAIHPSPSSPEAFFERGVEYLKTGDTAAAMKDFGDARRIKPDGQNIAFLAYCHSRAGNDPAASTLYREAIEKYGYHPAWVHSNRAYSLIKRGSPQDLRFAIAEANAALAIDPNLRAARLNRVYARYISGSNAKPQTIADPENCLADLNAVMSVGPYSGDLYYEAALILTVIGAGREEYRARAVAYLKEAVLLGKSPKRFAQEPVFRDHLNGRKDFEQVINLPPIKQHEPASNVHLVDPLNR